VGSQLLTVPGSYFPLAFYVERMLTDDTLRTSESAEDSDGSVLSLCGYPFHLIKYWVFAVAQKGDGL